MTSDELDNVFTALADDRRRQIIGLLLAGDGLSLFQICTGLVVASDGTGGRGISRQAVSQHLDILERAGIVRVAWSGRTKVHTLDLGPLRQAAKSWFNPLIEQE